MAVRPLEIVDQETNTHETKAQTGLRDGFSAGFIPSSAVNPQDRSTTMPIEQNSSIEIENSCENCIFGSGRNVRCKRWNPLPICEIVKMAGRFIPDPRGRIPSAANMAAFAIGHSWENER